MKKQQSKNWKLDLGANVLGKNKTAFKVWAPFSAEVNVKLVKNKKTERKPLAKSGKGYFYGEFSGVGAGARYLYELDGKKDRPDPVSRKQPDGVHGVSEVVNPKTFKWTDQKWKGQKLSDTIFYEMHVGTFTPEGTFLAAIKKIPYLKKLGITCLEIMPVAQFPGKRNWGYDGVGLFAVQNSYGGSEDLKKLVNACHKNGIAVCLDVVYNHFGPEGNYLHDYGPYFTGRYHTPWGDAINYDDRSSDEVKQFVLSNVLYWIYEYHMDMLRLDAIHSIFDSSAKPILEEMSELVDAHSKKLGRSISLIAESDLNDPKTIESREKGGVGIHAQWSDDFHHAVHTQLTGEKRGYYQDFDGLSDIVAALKNGFVYQGQYSGFRKRKHGRKPVNLLPEKFVTCLQNHDQVGNRAWGDRLNVHISFEAQKSSAALLMMAPYLPLIWMGQEYGETNPFQYFIDHGDPTLIEAVRNGRQREFRSFGWNEVPDPQIKETYEQSKLSWNRMNTKAHAQILKLYQDLIALRKRLAPSKIEMKFFETYLDQGREVLLFSYPSKRSKKYVVIISFAKESLRVKLPWKGKRIKELLRTDAEIYGGKCPEKRGRTFQGEVDLAGEAAMIGEIK